MGCCLWWGKMVALWGERQVYRNQAVWEKVCQLLAVGRWFPPGTPVSSTSERDVSSS